MKTPAKINASRGESGKMLIGLDGTGAGLFLLAGRIASGVLVTMASNEKELAELKNVMHKMIDEDCKEKVALAILGPMLDEMPMAEEILLRAYDARD